MESENLVEKCKWVSAGCDPALIIKLPNGYNGRIINTSLFLKLEGIVELVPVLKANKYDVTILNQWLKSLTLVAREFPRIAYETHMEINARKQQQRILQLEQALDAIPEKFRIKNYNIFYGLDKALFDFKATQKQCEEMVKVTIGYINPIERTRNNNIQETETMTATAAEMGEANNEFIRNYMLSRLPDDMKDFLKDCKDIHKPEELLKHSFNKLGFNQIVGVPHKKITGDITYQTMFYITALAKVIGYNKPESVEM